MLCPPEIGIHEIKFLWSYSWIDHLPNSLKLFNGFLEKQNEKIVKSKLKGALYSMNYNICLSMYIKEFKSFDKNLTE